MGREKYFWKTCDYGYAIVGIEPRLYKELSSVPELGAKHFSNQLARLFYFRGSGLRTDPKNLI